MTGNAFYEVHERMRKTLREWQDKSMRELTESVEKSVEIRHNDQNMSELPPYFDQLTLNESNKESILDEDRERFFNSEGCRALKSQYGWHMDSDRERTEK